VERKLTNAALPYATHDVNGTSRFPVKPVKKVLVWLIICAKLIFMIILNILPLQRALSCLLAAFVLCGSLGQAATPKKGEKKKTKAKETSKLTVSAPDTTAAKAYIAAQMQLLTVLDRYASALATATDIPTADQSVAALESIIADVITSGEAVVKLGKPTPTIAAMIDKDTELATKSQLVATNTRRAVASVSGNIEVKAILTPAIERFQAALQRLQQAAEDPQGPAPASPAPDAPAPPQ
jgi:hypothetical protein